LDQPLASLNKANVSVPVRVHSVKDVRVGRKLKGTCLLKCSTDCCLL